MRTRGTTILELAVSIAIAAMMFLIVGGIFIAQGRYLGIEDAISQTEYQAFQALDTAGLFLGSADRIVSSRAINGTTYTTGTSTVVVEIPSVDASGTIIGSTFDYVAIGQDPSNAAQFMYAIDSATGTHRLDGKFVKALLVDKVIFRYNAVDPTAATAVDLYVRTAKTARGRVIRMPIGKIYYLGSS